MLTEKIFQTVAYYNLVGYPLTLVEIVKFSPGLKKTGLAEISQTLEALISQKKITVFDGFYFLPGKKSLLGRRIERQKLAVKKTRRLKRIVGCLKFVPFIRLICLSGSFNVDNAKRNSDFDFLIVAAQNRLWLTRALITAVTFVLGWKRHGQKTRNRVCLNCFLTSNSLEITSLAKQRDFHSGQEYARLLPLYEQSPGLFNNFRQKNFWIKDFSGHYPWPTAPNFLLAKDTLFSKTVKRVGELFFNALGGSWLNQKLGMLQRRRIHSEKPTDQIYCSDTCLMLHPSSKAFVLLKKLKQYQNPENPWGAVDKM